MTDRGKPAKLRFEIAIRIRLISTDLFMPILA